MGSVEIISIGSEYIFQQEQTSGVTTVARRLFEMGVKVDYASAVIGQEAKLEEVLRQSIERAALIFVVSGVSADEYDLAKKLLTRVLKKRLILNYKMLDKIKAQFARQGEEMPGDLLQRREPQPPEVVVERNRDHDQSQKRQRRLDRPLPEIPADELFPRGDHNLTPLRSFSSIAASSGRS
jgi:hypothetical protein